MKIRFLIFGLLFVASALVFQFQNQTTAQTAARSSGGKSVDSKFGVVDVNADKVLCLRTSNPDLAENSAVSIVASDAKPQKILTARIEKKLPQSCAAGDSGADDAQNVVYYSLKNLRGGADSELTPGIAVFGANNKVALIKGAATADTNGDGIKEHFRLCASSEGLHLTVWNGAPLKAARVWHRYYYLNYDTEPNCTKKESADD